MSKKQTPYRLLSISLLESSFKRQNNIQISDPNFKEDINISNAYKKEGNKIFVILGLDLLANIVDNTKTKKKKQYEIKVKFLGVFEFDEKEKDNFPLDIRSFAKINASAIIFPFIREHVSYLSIRSNIKHILLPPMNFVKLNQQKQSKT